MAIEFKLPDIGEGIAEGEIVKWLVKVGDQVKEHQSIVEVMTDKATVEVPAPAAGKITALKAKEGDTVPVGSVIFVLDDAGAAKGATEDRGSTKSATKEAPKAGASAQGTAKSAASTQSAQQPVPPKASHTGRSSNEETTDEGGAVPSQSGKSTTSTPPPSSTSSRQPAQHAASKAPNASTAPAGANASTGSSASNASTGPKTSAGGSTLEFKLPDIGEGIAEGEIVKWLVKVGDQVKEHQSIVEVMTDKATVEVPAPASGTITALKAKEGDTVPVGSVIFVLATAGAGAGAGAASSGPAHAGTASNRPASGGPAHGGSATSNDDRDWVTRGYATEHAAAGSRGAPTNSGNVPAPAARGSGAGAPTTTRNTADTSAARATARDDAKVLAVPSARRLAREMNVALAEVPGSGRNGVVRRADVEAFANASASSAPARTGEPARTSSGAPARAPAAPISIPPGEREQRTPFRGVRRKIAEAMVRSKHTAAHFTVLEEVDVTQLVALREQAKTIGAAQNIKITYMPFIMKATALALLQFRELNGHLDEAAGEIVIYDYVNLGIAMDTDNGLIVPVIREVQAKNIMQLAAELAELADRTRAGKVKPEELRGSTFSITNAGNIGGIMATPIINFPDIAILGVHRIMKKPGVVETSQGDRIEVRQYMNFSCSVDHRLTDGANGARFLVYLKKLLENPGLLAL